MELNAPMGPRGLLSNWSQMMPTSGLQLAIFGERPMSLSPLLKGNDCFRGLTCALTNRWHQWNRNVKLYANFSGEEGAGNFLLYGYGLSYKRSIDYILLSQL